MRASESAVCRICCSYLYLNVPTKIIESIMHSSYSLHGRIPTSTRAEPRRRKRKVIQVIQQFSSLKYLCYSCGADVYFLPGHELVCSKCASRIVEKVNVTPKKRVISAR